jgi:hypothetical protein
MGLESLPDNTKPPEIFGYKPNSVFDRDKGAQSLGFSNEIDLIANGGEQAINSLNSAEVTWQENNDQISAWLENHMQTAQAVHDLDARLDALELRVTEQAARIRALEARNGIE